jgi:hypothetical protein
MPLTGLKIRTQARPEVLSFFGGGGEDLFEGAVHSRAVAPTIPRYY